MKARLISHWKRLRSRYTAMPPRERLLLPAALCFAILVLGHLLLIEPARKAHRQLQQQHTQDSSDLLVAQTQLKVLRAKLLNPDAELRAQLEALRRQTSSADDRFRELQGSLVPAQEMSTWLSSLMQAQRGLQLVGLRSLPVTSVAELVNASKTSPTAGAAPTASSTAAPVASHDAWLYRHGIEVTVRGSYPELLAYLHTLERMPRRVYWGELRLNAQDSPAVVMTLTVYTLSVDKTWWLI
jgi:MSHA biogenesis protein MshJ